LWHPVPGGRGNDAATRVSRWRETRATDEFAAEADREETETEENPDPEDDRRVLLADPSLSRGASLNIDPTTSLTPDIEQEGFVRLGRHEPDDGCPCCGASNSKVRHLFRPLRLGGPFMVGIAANVLLDAAPEGENALRSPHGGRQMLTFPDNRQGTARLAATLQREGERSYARAVMLHAVTVGDPGAAEDIAKLTMQLKTFENLAAAPGMSAVITQTQASLAKLRAGGLAWVEARRHLAVRNAEQPGLCQIWADRDPSFQRDEALADLQPHSEFLQDSAASERDREILLR
jgi:hypothetical protein